MKKNKLLLLEKIIFFTISYVVPFNGQTPLNDPHWQLVWEDNFDFFDTNKWVKVHYCDHDGEPQLYLDSNVWTSNGNLVIRVENKPINCPSSQPPIISYACGNCKPGLHMYRSGWVETTYSFNTQFGYIEARIKLPYGKGFWPAFWTFYGTGVNFNNSAEIDIFEMLGGALSSSPELPDLTFPLFDYPFIMTTNIHTYYPDKKNPYFKKHAPLGFDYTNWHKYAVEWSPGKIIWYVDDSPIRVLPNHGIIDPVRIILNLAIRKDVLPDYTTPFPSDMLVDYVRVYSLKKDCNDYIYTTQYDFSTYNNIEKNFIKIGTGGGQNSIPTGNTIYMRASDFIELEGDFTMPLGSSLYMDASGECSTNLFNNNKCQLIFNPCQYNFANYDNKVKKIIELGGNNCFVNIVPLNQNIILQATDKIRIKSGVVTKPHQNNSVSLKITQCQQ